MRAIHLTTVAFSLALAAAASAAEKPKDPPPAVFSQVTFENQTPSGWGVVIVGLGATWRYVQGSPDTVQKNGLNLPDGSPPYVITSPKAACVNFVRAAVSASIPDEGVKTIPQDTSEPAGECLQGVTFILAPKSGAMKALKGGIKDLEIRVKK